MTTELREQLLKSLRRQSKGELIEMIGRGLEVQDELWTARAALAESERARQEAEEQCRALRDGRDRWKRATMIWREEAVTRAILGVTPPRSGPLTNRDVGDESDARAKAVAGIR